MTDDDDAPPEVVPLGDPTVLDLHTFLPRECGDVVEEFVRAAHEDGHPAVRIIHGKGIGTLRRITHAVLAKHPAVASFEVADHGNWGATIAHLKPRA